MLAVQSSLDGSTTESPDNALNSGTRGPRRSIVRRNRRHYPQSYAFLALLNLCLGAAVALVVVERLGALSLNSSTDSKADCERTPGPACRNAYGVSHGHILKLYFREGWKASRVLSMLGSRLCTWTDARLLMRLRTECEFDFSSVFNHIPYKWSNVPSNRVSQSLHRAEVSSPNTLGCWAGLLHKETQLFNNSRCE